MKRDPKRRNKCTHVTEAKSQQIPEREKGGTKVTRMCSSDVAKCEHCRRYICSRSTMDESGKTRKRNSPGREMPSNKTSVFPFGFRMDDWLRFPSLYTGCLEFERQNFGSVRRIWQFAVLTATLRFRKRGCFYFT